jgi:hypothetical protein
MAQPQLYAKQQHTGEYVALDLRVEEPIKLNLSVANIIDPTATNSVFSRTFKVPHTAVNGPYFEGVFNVNSINFDASIKADAYILDNGIFFENGSIRLNAINVNSKDNSVEYEITFYGSTSDFGSKIGGGFLNEVNLNKYNHSKTWQNISSSWTTQGGLFNGDVRYGLIEWGYTYDNNNRPNIPTLSAGFDNSFTNPTAPTSAKAYRLTQWKPQIRAKALWDQIFEEAGYTYDSTFLDSSFFTNQYIISDNVASATLDNSNTFRAENQGVTYNVLAAQFPWRTPVEINDPGNNFTPSQTVSGIYTAPANGSYQFKMTAGEVDVYLYGSSPDDAIIGWEAKIIDIATNQVVGLDVGQWTFTQYVNTESLDASIYTSLITNQSVKFEFRTFRISGPVYSGSTQIQFFNTAVECIDAPNVMSINGIMPSNIRKIDFMKSIINRYRLVFVPSKFQANHFTITPWKDWILEGRSKDWTARLDTSKDMVIKPLFFDQARFQIYKDQEDSDYLNYNYQLGIKQTFGQLNLDSTNELIKGTKEYKDQFAPTPLDGIGLKPGTGFSEEAAALFLIPHIAKDTGGNGASEGTGANAVSVGKREPIQPKLRLVFWNGEKNAPIEWYAGTDQDGSGVPVNEQVMYKYPLMSQYSEFPVTSTTFDLNWENELPLYDYNAIGQAITNPKAQTAFSCFNTFWKTWYDVTFDPYSRIVEANFALDYNEILDLKFNDYIFVKDAWYFVNSVSDYVVGEVSNCRVQLIKLGNNIGITLPVVTPPTYTQFNTCYSATDLCTAHCCAQYAGSQNVIIYADGATLVDSTIAYQDANGGIIAAPGYYADQSGTIYVNSNGAILVQDTSACNCTPVSYPYTVHLNTTGCDVCCNNGPLITVYGSVGPNNFIGNSSFWTNSGLTIPGPAGFYKQTGATTALQVTPNGSVVNNFLCSNCTCTVYYPFTVCKSSTLCDACCCPNGTTTVWGSNPTFASNTNLYLDNTGANPPAGQTPSYAPAGWYKFNSTTVAQVTGMVGDITAFGTCSGCPTCLVGPVSGTVNVSSQKAGYTTSTTVQKSFDNGATWVDVVTVTIEALDPDDTEKSVIFSCEENVRLRAINSTTTVNGDMQTNYLINLDIFEDSVAQTPATVTLTIPSTTNAIYTYEFNNLVTGGDVVPTTSILAVGGQYTQYKTTTGLNDIAGLTAIADLSTSFDVIGGFTNSTNPNLARVESIVTYNDKIYVLGIFNQYKGNSIANRIACLNLDGSLDTTFNTNVGTGLSANTDPNFPQGKLYMSPTGKLYVTGTFSTFNGTTIIGRIFRLNLNGTLDTSFVTGTGFNDYITSIQFKTISGDEKLFVAGAFIRYNDISAPFGNARRAIAINSNGSIYTSFNVGTGFTGGFNTVVLDMALYNDKLYYTLSGTGGSSYAWKGTTFTSNVCALNLDGSLDTTFTTAAGNGFNQDVETIQVDSTGLYLAGEFSSYKGTTSHRVAKLGFDATLDTTFNNSTNPFTPFSTNRIDLKVVASGLYVWGRFATYRSFSANNLVKINKTDGSPITSFNVGAGFENTPNTDYVYTLEEVNYLTPPTTYQLDISYSNESPCAAYCARPYTTIIYGNNTSLVTSTVLYANSTGSAFAAAGWYSDGATIAQVDGNGVIISYTDINSCNCNTLYPFDVFYSATNECVACGQGVPSLETVYGIYPNWSGNVLLYADATGTTPAPQGWYAFNLTALHVGANGYVDQFGLCEEDCTLPELCAGVFVRNDAGYDINWNAQTCGIGNLIFGTIPAGANNYPIGYSCIDLNTLNVTGPYTITEINYC